MAAVLLPTYFITAMEWKFPWGLTKATTTPESYDKALLEACSTPTHKDLFILHGAIMNFGTGQFLEIG